MSAVQLTYPELNRIIDLLKKDYKIFAPVRLSGIGTYSDTDTIRYGEISSAENIEYLEKSDFSPKEIFFPITQTLFYYFNNEETPPDIDRQKYIIFMRPCDINALPVFDSVFDKNGSTGDFYYSRLREKVKIFMLECRDGFESCFCTAMDSNKTQNYECAFRFSSDHILCECQAEEFAGIFAGAGQPAEFTPEFVLQDHTKVRLPDIEKITPEMFNDGLWEEYTKRCIACGRCNFVCPTCTCWSMQDIKYDGQQQTGERRRVWASCHVDGYTDMAGGHSFRRANGERMRFKVFHKIYDFRKRFGYNMCTGCGRCDDVCPEYISYSHSINKVTRLTEVDK